MNRRFYEIFDYYKKNIRRYPVRINYMLIINYAKNNFDMQYKNVKIINEVDLEEKLYDLCLKDEIYFPHESEKLTEKILKLKKL